MKIDTITKITLIMIAAALWLNLLKPFLPIEAFASREGVTEVDIVAVGGKTIYDNKLPIKQ